MHMKKVQKKNIFYIMEDSYNESYIKGEPIINDVAYDALQRARKKPPEFENMAGKHNKVQHIFPMLSLEKAYTRKDIDLFVNRLQKEIGTNFNLVIEPKLDGVAVNSVYENSQLIRSSTRGDGACGEDITHLIEPLIPKNLPSTTGFNGEIRGELFVDREAFDYIKTVSNYRNGRNAIAGWLKNKNKGAELINKYGTLVCFDARSTNYNFVSTSKMLMWLAFNGFIIPFYEKLEISSVKADKIYDISAELYKEYINFNYPLTGSMERLYLPLDGIVLKVEENQYKEILGKTAYYPKWAIALKANKPEVAATIQDIVFQIGRTGTITPVAKISPVEIDGSTIKNVSLNNLDFLEKMDIRLGDTVLIVKAGQIIPQILEVHYENRTSGSSPLDVPAMLVEQGFSLIDNRWVCDKKILIQKVIYYCRSLKISNFGPSTIKKLVIQGVIENLFDIL